MKYLNYNLLFITLLSVKVLQAVPVAGGIAGTLTVKNSIIYNDTTFLQTASTVTLSNSAIRGTTVPPGTGNMLLTGYSGFADPLASPANTISYYLSPTSTFRNNGINISGVTPNDLNGNDRTYDGIIDIGPVEYSQIYKNGSGTWNTAAGWNTGRIPTTDDVVTIRSATNVNSTNAVCKSIIAIDENATLTISPAAQLVVSTSINNPYSDRLIVKSSVTQPNGTLIFHNTTNNPYATVEMYSMANKSSKADANGYFYKWQYFGIPVNGVTASPTFDGSYVRKWVESGTSVATHWVSVNNSFQLQPGIGYELTQNVSTGKTIVFQGQLVNSNVTLQNLPYTKSSLYPGQSILSNPFTAAIDVTKINFGSDIQQAVWLYTTGSFGDWGNVHTTSGAPSPGQYTVVVTGPSGLGMTSQIPSMQGMLVQFKPSITNSTTNSTVTIPYSAVIMNVETQRVKAAIDSSTSDKVGTRIDVTSTNSSDKMWLFTEPSCTHGFDNGWDGVKMMGNALTPQIFAIEPDGNYQIDAVDDINNIQLGFQAGTDTEYTLTFTHQNLLNKYSGIFLRDEVENKMVDITENGSTYSFVAESTPTALKRFMIVTQPNETNTINSSQLNIFFAGKTVFVQNKSNLNGEIMLYDLMGHTLKKSSFGSLGFYEFQVGTLSGSYIVNAYTANERLSKKIIVGN